MLYSWTSAVSAGELNWPSVATMQLLITLTNHAAGTGNRKKQQPRQQKLFKVLIPSIYYVVNSVSEMQGMQGMQREGGEAIRLLWEKGMTFNLEILKKKKCFGF